MATGTAAVKLHPVVKDLKTAAFGNRVLEGFDGFVLKFYDLPAPETDEVIMMPRTGDGFISGFSISEFSFLGQTQLGEEFEGPVNGGVANLRVDFRHKGMNLAEVLVPGGVKEDIEDFLTLSGRLQPPTGNPVFKSLRLDGKSPF